MWNALQCIKVSSRSTCNPQLSPPYLRAALRYMSRSWSWVLPGSQVSSSYLGRRHSTAGPTTHLSGRPMGGTSPSQGGSLAWWLVPTRISPCVDASRRVSGL